MHQESMRKLLKLEGFFVDSIEEKTECMLVYCHSLQRGMWYKGEYSSKVNTTRIRKLRHIVIDTMVVVLVIEQRKFYFSQHKKRLWEILPGVKQYKHTTQEFRKQTVLALRDTNYSGTAARRGTSVMFPIRLLDDMPDEQWCVPEDNILRIGLDGKGVRKHQQIFTVTNLDTKTLIGALPDQSQASLIRTLKARIPESVRMRVKEVCIDMDTFFLKVITEVFPHAHIVIDHFHVIAWGLHLLDQQKRIVQNLSRELFQVKRLFMKAIHTLTAEELQRLEKVFMKAPELKRSWKIIHQLRKVYWCTSYKEARSQLRKTMWLCSESHIPEMKQLAKTLRTWFEYILNYYISRSTNALTEGIHTRFELIKRHHFGIKNIERFTKRLFYVFLPICIFTQCFVQLC